MWISFLVLRWSYGALPVNTLSIVSFQVLRDRLEGTAEQTEGWMAGGKMGWGSSTKQPKTPIGSVESEDTEGFRI